MFVDQTVRRGSHTLYMYASAALQAVNKQLGLGFDDQDIAYYTELFMKRIGKVASLRIESRGLWFNGCISVTGRDPTIVELFDIGQSNSEHSRHWFFGGKYVCEERLLRVCSFPNLR